MALAGLRAKTHTYLRDNNDEDKKAKGTKKCVIKRKLNFEDYKNCLEADEIENKTSHLEKNKIYVNSLKEDQKEFIKNNKPILRTQQRFRSEKHNFFTEKEITEIDKDGNGSVVTISSNEWEKFNETTLPEKEEFYSNLNMEDITGSDYKLLQITNFFTEEINKIALSLNDDKRIKSTDFIETYV